MGAGSRDLAADLACLDAISRAFVARAEPVQFGIAHSAAEREAVFRLRYQTVIAQGWIAPAALADGQERDADDERAVHLACWNGALLAATARLIFPVPTRRLPTEEVFGIEVGPRGRVVNLDRLAVAAAYSDRHHRVFLGLLGRIWLEVRAHGYSTWVGIDSAGMNRLCRILGFEMSVLAPAQPFWGEVRVPIRFDGASAAAAVIARWGHIAGTPRSAIAVSRAEG